MEADRDKFCYPSFDVGSDGGCGDIIDNVRAYVPPFPAGDLLDLPTIPIADITLGGEFDDNNLPSLYLNTTRR